MILHAKSVGANLYKLRFPIKRNAMLDILAPPQSVICWACWWQQSVTCCHFRANTNKQMLWEDQRRTDGGLTRWGARKFRGDLGDMTEIQEKFKGQHVHFWGNYRLWPDRGTICPPLALGPSACTGAVCRWPQTSSQPFA